MDTLREELTNQETERNANYKNALRKSQEVMNDIKENEFRYWICHFLFLLTPGKGEAGKKRNIAVKYYTREEGRV